MKVICILLICYATIFVTEIEAKKIPMPPWANTTGSPTSSYQALEYFYKVLPLVSQKTTEELNEALDRDASEGELLSIIYNENLNQQLFDYENPGLLANGEPLQFSALKELMETLKLYENQWHHHFEKTEEYWSLQSGSRNSLGNLIKQIMDFEELAQRVKDPNDMLENIEEYENVFNIPGAAYTILIWGCHLLEPETYPRSRPILQFLTSDKNKNLFVKGGSHFWYGYLLYRYYKEYNEALENLYVVHTYPACLVNIDWSYILAAKIFIKKSKPETALALLSIRIPTMDHQIEEIRKAKICFNILYEKNNIMDATLQITRVLNANQNSANQNVLSMVNESRNKLETKWPNLNFELLLRNAILSNCYENYEMKVIEKALTGPEKAKNNPMVMDMLLHYWPMIDDIDSSIITNRMLCNNIFGQERRTDIILE